MRPISRYPENRMIFPPARWRLLNTGEADGAMNMAIDEAILRAVAAGLVLPTLRFYAWQPACLSLGQAQSFADVDGKACAVRGYHVVRRPTGGRAILHTDELTYSVTAPEAEPRVSGGIVESYRRLSEGLLEGLRLLGVPGIEAHHPEAEQQRASENPVCFQVPSTYEITVGSKKLIGSAQVRREGVVLQHGTLPLVGDIARICDVLASEPDPIRVRDRAATVESVLGRAVSFDEAVEVMARGFASALNLELVPGDLLPQERTWAEELRRERYATDAWNRRL
jgi:lipoate-protein ligase A